MSQVTNVSQLLDVSPEDWAFTALSNLVERYGCIAGYPNGNFLGNRTLTRYEFAAGLNACLVVIEKLSEARKNNSTHEESLIIKDDDLQKIQRLKKEFELELTTLKKELEVKLTKLESRIDCLEAKTAVSQCNPFLPTAKIGGEAIFSLSTGEGGNPPGTGEANVIMNYLARIGIASSFTGTDRLSIILSSGNFENSAFAGQNSFNTYSAFLSFQNDFNNSIFLDSLEYRFATFSNRVVFTFKPVGFNLSTVLTANTIYLSPGTGSISRFAEASPLFKIGDLDAGMGFDWMISKPLRFQMAYGTRNSNDPNDGFIGADDSAFGVQLLFNPNRTFVTGVHYINFYSQEGNLNTFTGSFNADTAGFFVNLNLLNREATQTHAVGGSFQWRFAENLLLGGWGGYTFTNAVNSDKWSNTSTYLFSLGILDPFGKEGNLLAILIGQPLKLKDGRGLSFGRDNATSLHYEIFYRYRLNDRIDITPGFFLVTNPDHRSQNNNIFIGVLRSTFRFQYFHKG